MLPTNRCGQFVAERVVLEPENIAAKFATNISAKSSQLGQLHEKCKWLAWIHIQHGQQQRQQLVSATLAGSTHLHYSQFRRNEIRKYQIENQFKAYKQVSQALYVLNLNGIFICRNLVKCTAGVPSNCSDNLSIVFRCSIAVACHQLNFRIISNKGHCNSKLIIPTMVTIP